MIYGKMNNICLIFFCQGKQLITCRQRNCIIGIKMKDILPVAFLIPVILAQSNPLLWGCFIYFILESFF